MKLSHCLLILRLQYNLSPGKNLLAIPGKSQDIGFITRVLPCTEYKRKMHVQEAKTYVNAHIEETAQSYLSCSQPFLIR